MSDTDIMVSIQHLEKSFGDTEVLRDVNIDVKRGEVVVVLGPSGSGKSTMLRSFAVSSMSCAALPKPARYFICFLLLMTSSTSRR